MTAPFHRLLSYYSNRNPDDSQTIRLQDSIRGNLALGLDFPVALCIAVGRHLFLKNTSLFSLNIHVPSVSWRETPLHDVSVDAKKEYGLREFVDSARREVGVFAAIDAAGVWALAADVKTGRVSGGDVVHFQRGTLFEEMERRRRASREQVLPLWRGGPISVVGHSWAVKRFWGLDVYRDDGKRE